MPITLPVKIVTAADDRWLCSVRRAIAIASLSVNDTHTQTYTRLSGASAQFLTFVHIKRGVIFPSSLGEGERGGVRVEWGVKAVPLL